MGINQGLIYSKSTSSGPGEVTTDGTSIKGNGSVANPVALNSPGITGNTGKKPRVNAGGNGFDLILDDFLNLIDTPSSYTGEAGKIVAVNAGETGLEFIENSISTDYGRIVYVATTGNDSTGTRGDMHKPFLTINAAYAAATEFDTIHIFPGGGNVAKFVASLTITKSIYIYCEAGVTLAQTAGTRFATMSTNSKFLVITGRGSIEISSSDFILLDQRSNCTIVVDVLNVTGVTGGRNIVKGSQSVTSCEISIKFVTGQFAAGQAVGLSGSNNKVSVTFDRVAGDSTTSTGISQYAFVECYGSVADETTLVSIHGYYYDMKLPVLAMTASTGLAWTEATRKFNIDIDIWNDRNLGFFYYNDFKYAKGSVNGSDLYSIEQGGILLNDRLSEINWNIPIVHEDNSDSDYSIYAVDSIVNWYSNFTKIGNTYAPINISPNVLGFASTFNHFSGKLEVTSNDIGVIEMNPANDTCYYNFYTGCLKVAEATKATTDCIDFITLGTGTSFVRLFNDLFTNGLKPATPTYLLTGTDIIPGENIG